MQAQHAAIDGDADPDVGCVAMEWSRGPIGASDGQDAAQPRLAIRQLDPRLDPGLSVEPHHQAGLVVQALVSCPGAERGGEPAGHPTPEEVAAVPAEAVVRLPPEIR